MYWNNPTIEVSYPSDRDPIQQSSHNGQHCLFYDPSIPKDQIDAGQTLQQLCDWANQHITTQGVDGFISNKIDLLKEKFPSIGLFKSPEYCFKSKIHELPESI
jgi:hypothetical protein